MDTSYGRKLKEGLRLPLGGKEEEVVREVEPCSTMCHLKNPCDLNWNKLPSDFPY